MPFELAKKIEELDFDELLTVLQNLQQEDRDAFNILKEIVEDL